MRLSLIFLMLILLPVATGLHAWLFANDEMPKLTEQALQRLREAGVRDPVVNLEFLDISVSGEAESPEAVAQALQAIRALGPLRLRDGGARLQVTARIKGVLEGDRLRISGWLPDDAGKQTVEKVVGDLRPDLKLDTSALMTASEVRWPEGLKPPLTADSAILKPLLEKLRVPAELHMRAEGDTISISGLLPSSALKEELVSALTEVAGSRVVDPSGLQASTHVMEAPFAKVEALAALARSFFKEPPPRTFDIDQSGTPRLKGTATRQLEGEWLALLRPLTGAAKVDAQLTLLPSMLHAPGYVRQSALPAETLTKVDEALRLANPITFEAGTARLMPEEQAKLASLAPALLSAGPALSLVIGAHSDPTGQPAAEKAVGKARAEAVLSFLIEQGVPSSDISATVFDSVPAGSPQAAPAPRCVEILIK